MNENKNPYEGLEEMMKRDCVDQKPFVFLHPFHYGVSPVSAGLREYEEDEVYALEKRDFETRLFMSGLTFEGDSMWLRTHWTDNHIHKTVLNSVRDYFKAVNTTKNFTAAKAALSELLTMCLKAEKSNYYSFAITMASGLSDEARNTSFQVHQAIIKSDSDITLARKRLCISMHNLFESIKSSEFLYSGEGSNIFRLIHCKTYVSEKGKLSLVVPFLSFMLQIVLVVFVFIHQLTDNSILLGGSLFAEKDRLYRDLSNLLLAIVTLIYSFIVAWPGLMETHDAFKLYEKRIGPIQMIDFITNTIVPVLLLFNGFFLILQSELYMDAVLNTAALLFIPEIDDSLPGLMGYNEPIIIKNYLVKKLLLDFDKWCTCEDEDIYKMFRKLKSEDPGLGVQFGDYYLTHQPEQGSIPEESTHFQPYEVKKGQKLQNGESLGHQINPVNSVNENCLIRKIYWSYTTGEKYRSTIKPRIGFLRLEMINGEIIEINMKGVNKSLTIKKDTYHKLEGVFIITTFQMSSAILKLRLCGSRNADDFMTAFDYYSLWEFTRPAETMLEKYQKHLKTYQPSEYYTVCNGLPRSLGLLPEDGDGIVSRTMSTKETIQMFISKSLFSGEF